MSEYRASARKQIAPVHVRVLAVTWTQWLYVLPWVVALVWATSTKTGMEAMKQAGAGLLFVGVLLIAYFPVLSFGAKQEGAEIVITGSRIPGATVMYTMLPEEAKGFSVVDFENGKKKYVKIALDVTDGRRLFFTRNGFRGRAAHERAVTHLNAWLEQVRQG